MRSLTVSQASKKNKTQTEDTSHTLGIVSSLFSNLASESSARIRLLAKFVENTYEKVDKLLEIRDAAQGRLNEVEAEIETEKKVRTLSALPEIEVNTQLTGARSRGRKNGLRHRKSLVPAQTGGRSFHVTNR